MASLNKVLLIGNLTRETELRHTPNGAAVCEIGLAVNRKFTVNGQEQEEACFIDVTIWGKQAESCDRYLEKGSSVLIEGRLQFDQWQDKTSGANRSKLRVVAERVQFMPRSGGAQTNNSGGYQKNNYGNNAPQSGQGNYGNNAPQSGQGYYTPPQQESNNSAVPAPPPPQNNQQAPPPQMPDGAFDVGKGAEDDIPF